MNVGPTELGVMGVIGLLGIVPLVLGIWVALDASRFPDRAFERADTSETLWIVLPIVGVVACGIVSVVAAIVWFSSYRSKIVKAAAASADTTG